MPGRRHEMMSGRGWFDCAAHSAPARSLFSYSAPFSEAHSTVQSLILLPRRHSFPWFVCLIVVICSRPMPSSSSLVPLVVSFGEERDVAMSSDYVGKQAGRVGDAIRIRSCSRPSVVSRPVCRLVRRGVGRGVPVVVRAIMGQAMACSCWMCGVVPPLPVLRTSVRYMDTAGLSSSSRFPLSFPR